MKIFWLALFLSIFSSLLMAEQYRIDWGDGTTVTFTPQDLVLKKITDPSGTIKNIFYAESWQKDGKLDSWIDEQGVPRHIYKNNGEYNAKVVYVGDTGTETVLADELVKHSLIVEAEKPVVSVIFSNSASGGDYYEDSDKCIFTTNISFPAAGSYFITRTSWFAQIAGIGQKSIDAEIARFRFPIPSEPEPSIPELMNLVWVQIDYSWTPDGSKHSIFQSVTSQKTKISVKDVEPPGKAETPGLNSKAYSGENLRLETVTVSDNNPWLVKESLSIALSLKNEQGSMLRLPGGNPASLAQVLAPPYTEDSVGSTSVYKNLVFLIPMDYVGDYQAEFLYNGYTFNPGDTERTGEEFILKTSDRIRPNVWVYFYLDKQPDIWFPGESESDDPDFNLDFSNNLEVLPDASGAYRLKVPHNTRMGFKIRAQDNIRTVGSTPAADGHLITKTVYNIDGASKEATLSKIKDSVYESENIYHIFSSLGMHSLVVEADDAAGTDPYGSGNNHRTLRFELEVVPVDFFHQALENR